LACELDDWRLRIKPIEISGVNVLVLVQAAANRICRYVFKLSPKIGRIPNPVFVKALLPDLACELGSDFERETALNALGASFDGLIRSRRQQDVEVFRHHGKSMQFVSSLIAVMKKHLNKELGICGSKKQCAPLICSGGESIGRHLSE
jgi:hypothetical protein